MDLVGRLKLDFGQRLPMVYQTEAAECGLACLAMVSGFHRGPADLVDLRRSFAVSLKGTRLSDLVATAALLGLSSRPLRLELDELGQLQCPCILHWDLNHFVVLREIRRGSAIVHDPASGIRTISLAQLSEHFSGVALELTPNQQFRPAPSRPALRLRDLVGRAVGLKRSLGQVLVLAIAIELFLLIQPFFLQWVVDHALVSADRDLLLTLAVGFALVMLMQVVFTAMRAWMLIAISASLQVQSSGSLFSHLQKLPASFFETRQLGDVMSRFSSMSTIQQALTTDVVEAVLDGLLAVVTLGVMFLLSPMLAATVVAVALAYMLLRWALYAPLQDASMEAIVWAARRDTHFLESMRAAKTVKLMVGQDQRRVQWLNLLVETVNRELQTQKLAVLFRTVNGVLQGLLTVLVVWLAAGMVLDRVLTVGAMLAFIAYKNQFLTRITALTDKAVELRMLRLHGERLADIALATPEDTTARKATQGMRASLSLRNLSFRYADNEPWVLDGIDLHIEAGESVAIVGASGCGKSTLLKIMSSLVRPSRGEMLVGGEPVDHWGLDAYRQVIGVVMQDDQLLSGSIADNICFFAPRPDRDWIEECARMASVHADVLAMPMGYESLIGDMGSSVSGGQKQRILIARALYRRPRILLLDEATSHLDPALEAAVNEAIQKANVTRILVAHRTETIRSAARIVTLDAGRVVGDTARRQQLPAGSSMDTAPSRPAPTA